MKTFKRALSVTLAMAMILSSFFIFDPTGLFPTAEAAVTATDPTYGDLYFIVPEAIYLAPKHNSSTASTSSNFQWYVNNSLDIDDFNDTISIGLDTGESATGRIAFLYPQATSVKISYKWQTEPGLDMNVNGNEATITYGDGTPRGVNRNYTLGLTDGYASTQITWGVSPQIADTTTGIWICWTATYTDGADGVEKQAFAYTYLYKPYVAPISVGIRSLNTRSYDHNGSYLSWISGVHGVQTAKSGSKYANTSGYSFLPFASSASGSAADELNFTLSGYMTYPDDNLGPSHWLSDSRTGVNDATVYYKSSTESSHGSGDDFTITYAYSPTGMLTVDKSRYSNLNQIPNLSVGLMVTDDESSTSGGAWFISNFDSHTSKFDEDHTDYWEYKSSNYGYITEYWEPLYNGDKIGFGGNWNDMSAGEGEGLKVNRRWRKDIKNKSSGVYYIGSGYANQQSEKFLGFGWNTGTDRIFDTAELRCRIEMFDRSALRDAYYYAIKSFPANNTQLLGSTTSSWSQFIELFNAVATWLCKVDCGAYTTTLGYNTATALANALKAKVNAIKPLSNPDRQTYIASQYNIKVYDDNGTWKLVTRSGAVTDEYHMGAHVEYTAEEYPGYSLVGHVKDYRETQSNYGGATAKQRNNVTPGGYDVPHAMGPVSCSYYYLRDEYTITYDLGGGELANGVTNPTSYNIDSDDISINAPVKPGFTFEGWTSESDSIFVPVMTITIPQGSTGNRDYKAIWGARNYSVIYHGNGSTGGGMSPSVHTTDVAQTLSANTFFREYNISFTYNIWDEWDTDYDTLVYLFDGWNTAPDGSGDAFVNRQSVINLTTDDEFHLYAQWYPQQYVLPTPEKDGYAFDGWYSTPNFTPSSFVGDGGALFSTDQDIDLYAKWAENQYNIIYDGNGATGGSTPKSTHVQGESKQLNQNGFERQYTVSFDANGGTVSPVSASAAYQFSSWNTKADGTGTGYSPDYTVVNPADIFKDENDQPVNTLVLYAQWSTQPQTTIMLPTPTRPGYSFLNWYRDAGFTQPVYGSITPTENTTLFARWTPASYVITFDAKGGTAVPFMPYNTEYETLLPETTRTGYSFDGWKPRDTEGNWDSGRIYAAGTPVTGRYGNVTLDAQWTPVRYKITFDVNGGDNYPNVFYTIESEDEIGEPTRSGYLFQGWTVTTADTGSNWTESVYAADTLLTGKYGNVTLQAQWLKASYTITFFTNGGSQIPDLEYDTLSTATLPTPVKTGFTFGGWKPHESSGSWDINTIYVGGTALAGKYGNVQLDAQWSQTQYMISYDERGGVEIPNTIYNVDSLDTLPETTRTAYTFNGWKPKTAVGSWDPETVYPYGTNLNGKFGDVTLTAQWTPVVYTITFDPNGAEYYPNPGANTMTYTIEDEDALGEPVRPGYKFLGWLVLQSEGNWLPVGSTYRSTAIVARKYGNIELQAMWEENVYNITYVLGTNATVDPETPNPSTYTYDTPTFTLNNPERTGYTFAGWTGTDLDEPTLSVDVLTHSEGDRSYTATWDLITYTIRYDLQNGYADPELAQNPTTYTVETPGITLMPPKKDGYDFDGWTSTILDGKQMYVTIFAGTVGNLIFTAHWKAKTYTISYDLAGGELPGGLTNPETYDVNIENDIVLHNPERSGFTFGGWTGTGLTGRVMTVTILAGSSGDRSYTATWNPIGYTITYDLDGGFMPEGYENPETYNYNTETFTLNNPEKTGYTFAGWTGSNGGNAQMAVAIPQGSTGNKSYLAHWSVVTYQISYNLNGGVLTAGVTNPENYTIESDPITLHNPTQLGHTFAGWTGTGLEEATTSVVIPTGSTGTRSYVATWIAAQYTITYDLAGGAMPEGVENPTSYGYNTETFALRSPVREGYTFTGWTGSNGEVPQIGVQITQGSSGNRVYTANWTAIEYTISYDLVGGAFTVQNPTTYTIETDTFTLNNPERTGYAFIGWTGTGIEQGQAESRVIIVKGSTGNRSYVAQWDGDAVTYNIDYHYDPGEEDPTKPLRRTYTVNTPTFMLNAPIRQGYTFTGWSGSNGNDPELQVYINGNGFVPGDKNYYANWTPNTYYIAFSNNGGTGTIPSLQCTYNPDNPHITLPHIDPDNFKKTGFVFGGWAKTADATTAEYSDGQELFENLTYSGTLTLYAVWTARNYSLTFAKGITTPGVVTGSVANITYTYTVDPDTGEPATVVNLPTGEENNFFVCYSVEHETKRSFRGWTGPNGDFYAPGAEFTCPVGGAAFTAVWSANYYYLDTLVDEIEEARDNDAVPANDNDPQYKYGGEYAVLNGSDGTYPWDNYDMETVELELFIATSASNRDLPQDQQERVTRLKDNLQAAYDARTLYDVDYDEPFPCGWSSEGFYDTQNGIMYPPCEDGEEHSYNSIMALVEEVISCDPDECLYTAESVQNLYEAVYGNNFDKVGIVTQVENAALKLPATDVLSSFVDQIAEAYHTLLKLKAADYTALDELITVYLPGMHDDVEAGRYVTYSNLESFYTAASANRLRNYYNRIDRTYKNVDQWRIMPGGNVYNTLKARIDALVPVGADYTYVFYEILNVPYGSDDFEYPAPNVIMANYPTWSEWAQANDGDISSQMDDEYLRACYTEKSVTALYRVLDAVDWNMNIFEQDAVDGTNNITSYRTLLRNATDALRQRKYTITYMLNDGTNASFTTQGDYEYGSFIGNFPINTPERQDYVFGGWSEDPDDPTPVSVDDRVYGNMYLYAIWVSNYTILYNLNGGVLPDGTSNPTAYSEVSGDITLVNPIRPGYEFFGWTGTDLLEPTMTVTIPQGSTGSRSYAATWEPKTFTIGYDLAGGTLATGLSNPTSYTIESRRITLNNPTLTGYDFAGWTGTDLSEPTVTVSIATGSIGNRSYTATWAPHAYTITFLEQDLIDPDATNPLTTENPTTYTIESDAITLLNPEKAGCTFIGWISDFSADPQILVEIPQGSTGDLTFTAVWEIESYQIRYTLNGGALPSGTSNPRFYNVTSATITLVNPVRDGYDFAGWTGTGLTEPTMTVVIPTGSTGYRAYVATWAAAAFPITYDLGGGTSDNPTSYTSDTETFALHDPVRAGYDFAGWTGSNGTTPQMRVLVYEGSSGALSFTANWTVVEYTITYALNNGTATNPTTYTIETPTFTLAEPNRPGYAFVGWTGSNSDSPQRVVQIVQGSTGERAYTANWAMLEYTISYNLADGALAESNPTVYTVTSASFTLNNPTKTGYTFAGWTGTGLDEATQYVTIARGSTGNRDYLATWTPVQYSIFYYLGGGNTDNPATYTIETDTFTLTEPTKDGYTFTGWTGDNGSVQQKEVQIVKGSTGEKSFVAHWSILTYALSYDLAGGTLEADNPLTYTVESNEITLNNPTRVGYDFTGWTGTDLDEATMAVTIAKGSTGDRAYTATWSAAGYTISYDLAGGEATNPTSYTTETPTFTLTAPTRDGYTFAGWTGSNGIAAQMTVTIYQGSTGNKTYTATWTAIGYTISYDLAGGAVATANPTTYTIESDPITLVNPTREGYVFAGWTGTGLDTATVNVTIATGSTGDRSYTATWTTDAYTISYDLAGGDATNPATYTIESDPITLVNPTKYAYTFAGWTGTGLTEPTMEVTIATGSTGNRSYTATWMPAAFRITYELSGGEASNPTTYTIESDNIVLTDPVRAGYEFTGWTGTDLTDPTMEVIIETGSTGDRTYTATWTPVTYSIRYRLNGGSARNPGSYTIESSPITLVNPTREGYTFAGWTGSNSDTPEMTVTIATGSTGNRTYEANWTAVEYSISYELDGGAVATANPTTYTIDSDDITLVNPTREGYAFAGWTGTDLTEATQTVTIAAGSTGNRSYTATWTAAGYTISYDLAGGAVATANPTTYTIESDDITLVNPTREGYTFAGWTGTDLDEASTSVTITTGSTGDRSYTATWTADDYTISYDLAGGAVATANPTTYTIESDDITLVNPTREGYTFAGWTGTDLDEAAQTVTIATGSTGDRSYTATWTADDYTISYDLAGGAVATANPTTYTIDSDDITLVNPTREGYAFAGWTGTDLTEATQTVTIAAGSTGNRSYTATWTAAGYTISYDLAGGAVATANPTTYTIESDDITLVNPTREGYTFAGWTGTDLDEAAQTVTIATGSTGNRSYTATWTAAGFTISYDLAGGAVATANPTTYTIESDDITLVNPTREGYTFAGWTGSNGDEPQTEITIATGTTGNKTYTANWTADDYTISYDLAGGAVATANPTTYTIESNDITLVNPTREGYTFAGWTGTDLDEAATSVTIATGSTGDRSYTATWTADDYTISYDLAGGAVATANPTTYTIESDDITLVNPTREGYTFAGWTGTDLDEATMEVTIATGSTGDRSYTATWTAVDYTISYDLAGGAVATANPTTYTIESDDITLVNPTREGYTFAGWTGTDLDEATMEVTIATGSTGDRSYTATWTADDYTISYDLAGGAVATANPTTYTIESDDITLVNPTREGYTFAGWTGTDLDEATMEVTIATGSTGDRSYTATWTADDYTISYDLAGGAVATANPTTYTIESDDITLVNPTREGYTFAGWTGTDLDEAATSVTIATGSTGDRSYTATWTAVDYTISYDLAGGALAEGESNPTTYTIESDDITLVNPTREGYAFAGWTGTDLDEATMEVTIATGSTGDRSYTATWTAVDYTITYDLAGGALAEGESNPGGYSFESDDITLVNPTREGYTFAGWTGTGLDAAATTVTIATGSTGDRSYTATWTADSYSITYDLDGGEGENPTTYTIESGDIVLTAPTREGYIFSGWTGTDIDEMTTAVTIRSGSTGDRSYTAHWSTDGYTISYDLDGGTGANPTYYTIETETFTLAAPARAGYTFAGWTGSNGDEPQTEVTIAQGSSGNKSYKANWTAIKYFIEYHSNTDDDESFTMEYTYDQTYAVPANSFTKIGATFEGWSATVNGELITEIRNMTTGDGDRLQLFAVWADIDYALSFETPGATTGDNLGQIISATYGKTVNLPNGAGLVVFSDENAESRTFIGWLYDGTVYEPGAEFTCPANNVVFTAVWSANYYALDQLVDTIEAYRESDAVPAGSADAQYQAGGAIAEQIGSDGTYAWDTYDMTDVEAALENAGKAENRGLPQAQQADVDALTTALQSAIDAIVLADADYDAATDCAYAEATYPSCEAEGKHSYNSILALVDTITEQDDADSLYTADSVAALRTAIDGIKAEVEAAALKAPAQALLDAYVGSMAEAYHTTLVLKTADYTALDKLISDMDVDYDELETYYTADSVASLKDYYENIDRTYTIVEQAKIEAGGEIYEALKAEIDALVPLTADYTDVFALILTIPSGTEGFSYPAADVTDENYAAWAEWAQENAGAIGSQMDNAYLTTRYTEASVNALYRVLNGINWQKSIFQQAEVNDSENFMSYTTLLENAINGLKDRKYTVTYMLNDGTDTVFATQGDYLYGDEIGAFPADDPTREEYLFKGWSSSADEAVPVGTDAAVTADTTLYAIWKLASEELVELVAAEGSTTVIDEELGYIYGLKLNLTEEELFNDFLEVIGNGHLELAPGPIGTGTELTFYNDNTNTVVATYTLVIFGDTNGDGDINSSDVTDIRMMNAGLIETEPATVYTFAADLNHDGSVNSTDVTAIRMLNAGVAEYDQAEREII